jgi:hypothetical protein
VRCRSARYLFKKSALIFQQATPMIEFKANIGFSDEANPERTRLNIA